MVCRSFYLLRKLSEHKLWDHLLLLYIQYRSQYNLWILVLLGKDQLQSIYWYFGNTLWYYMDFSRKRGGREKSERKLYIDK